MAMLVRQKLKDIAASACARAMSTSMVAGPDAVKLPDLPYEYSALEPYISAEIMELHHSKHHQAYVSNYNKALEQWQMAHEKQDSGSVPAIASALHFNGGGAALADMPVPCVLALSGQRLARIEWHR
jgi:superoxide dismutase, Fe-Mn family